MYVIIVLKNENRGLSPVAWKIKGKSKENQRKFKDIHRLKSHKAVFISVHLFIADEFC